MNDGLNMRTAVESCEDFSGVDGDGLGQGETGFEGEEFWWEEEYCAVAIARRAGMTDTSPRQALTAAVERDTRTAVESYEDFSGVDRDGLGRGEVGL